jgi:hypothetical protein
MIKNTSVTVSFLLDSFYDNYVYHQKFTNPSPQIFASHSDTMVKYAPSLANNKAEVSRVMVLISGVVPMRLFQQYWDSTHSQKASLEIEELAMQWLEKLEAEHSDKPQKRRCKPKVIGMGKRIALLERDYYSGRPIPLPRDRDAWQKTVQQKKNV